MCINEYDPDRGIDTCNIDPSSGSGIMRRLCCRMAWWESSGYRSLCLPSVESEEEEEADDLSVTSTDSEHSAISYVLGDVTHPYANQEDAIIVHCVGMESF